MGGRGSGGGGCAARRCRIAPPARAPAPARSRARRRRPLGPRWRKSARPRPRPRDPPPGATTCPAKPHHAKKMKGYFYPLTPVPRGRGGRARPPGRPGRGEGEAVEASRPARRCGGLANGGGAHPRDAQYCKRLLLGAYTSSLIRTADSRASKDYLQQDRLVCCFTIKMPKRQAIPKRQLLWCPARVLAIP